MRVENLKMLGQLLNSELKSVEQYRVKIIRSFDVFLWRWVFLRLGDFYIERIKDGYWEVYYLGERDNKLGKRLFNKEEDACSYFYEWVMLSKRDWLISKKLKK